MLSNSSRGGSGTSSAVASVSAPISRSQLAPSIWRQSSTSCAAAMKDCKSSKVAPAIGAVASTQFTFPFSFVSALVELAIGRALHEGGIDHLRQVHVLHFRVFTAQEADSVGQDVLLGKRQRRRDGVVELVDHLHGVIVVGLLVLLQDGE